MCANVQTKGITLSFWIPNLPKTGFWHQHFKNLSLGWESAPPRYYVSEFHVKMVKFETFSLNLGKLPNYVQYFGWNIVEGVAESWMEAERSCVEIDEAGWRWMELCGVGSMA